MVSPISLPARSLVFGLLRNNEQALSDNADAEEYVGVNVFFFFNSQSFKRFKNNTDLLNQREASFVFQKFYCC